VLAVGDGALGFWNGWREVFPEAREGRFWFHKTASVSAALPKSAHPGAKKALAEIWGAEDKDHALAAGKAFDAAYGAKFPQSRRQDHRGRRRTAGLLRLPSRALGAPAHDQPDHYIKPDFRCLRCIHSGPMASARTHYLHRCLRRTGSDVAHVTCDYPLLVAALHVSRLTVSFGGDMSPPQAPWALALFAEDTDNPRIDLRHGPPPHQGHQGPGSRAAGLAMAFKLIESTQDRWRAVNAPHLIALVRAGATFINGKLAEASEAAA
jgi:hypothetical protein